MQIFSSDFLLLKLAETFGVIAVLLIAGTSGRLEYRPVTFKYPSREVKVSIVLFGLLLALAVLFSRSNFLSGIGNISPELQPLASQLVLSIVCLAISMIALYYRRQPLLSAGWGKRPNLMLGFRLAIMLVFLTIFLRGKIMAIVNGVSAQEGMALLLITVTCFAEESIFRGYLQLRLCSLLGKRNGWLLTSALFVLWTLPRLLKDPSSLWLNLGLVIVQSVLLGWVMQKSGHVLTPALYRAVSEWLTVLA